MVYTKEEKINITLSRHIKGIEESIKRIRELHNELRKIKKKVK